MWFSSAPDASMQRDLVEELQRALRAREEAVLPVQLDELEGRAAAVPLLLREVVVLVEAPLPAALLRHPARPLPPARPPPPPPSFFRQVGKVFRRGGGRRWGAATSLRMHQREGISNQSNARSLRARVDRGL